MAETAKNIILNASGSESPVTYTIRKYSYTKVFATADEGRAFQFAPFTTNLNLMDLIQGEMTTVEISTSGSGDYAIIVE